VEDHNAAVSNDKRARSNAGEFLAELSLVSSREQRVVFGDHSLIGIFDLLIGRRRSRRAVATKSTQLLRISSSAWLDMMEDNARQPRGGISRAYGEVGGAASAGSAEGG
jgi:hypothetical protein